MTVRQRFETYHHDNPHVYDLFVQYARQVKAAGKTRYSIWAVANQVRWHYDIAVSSSDPFKISNDYLCHYSRLIMEREADLHDFFKTKALKGESALAA